MLLLASIDRYYSSKQLYRAHFNSATKTTRIIIIVSTVVITIYILPMLFIYYWDESTKSCYLISNTIANIYTCSQFIIYFIIAPLLMIIFGFSTIINVRRRSTRLIYLNVYRRQQRTEKQLVRMLILQVGVHISLILPYGIIYCINAFQPSTRTPDILALRYILTMWNQLDYFILFFLYFTSGKIYRQQLIRALKSLISCRK